MAIEDVAVRREVILPVDRETAWAALEDPQELATWLADEVDIEIAVGAQGWLRWEDGEQRHAKVEEVQPGRRIVLRWSE
ncbi:MAG: SRPBCC domain-containing protein, partial [Solirubrobacterales bacterium]|nr:SRPBCC domain-containing protein [Solirubrobacterales bacterium]